MSKVVYKKTQRATAVVGLMFAAFAGVAFAATVGNPLVWIVGVVLAVAGVLFSSLTICVDEEAVSWYFGPGFWRKSVPLREIERVECVRNRWWYGWGIRLTPHGWLYNVSGLDAVELQLFGGRTLRLGTGEPERLRLAVEGKRRDA